MIPSIGDVAVEVDDVEVGARSKGVELEAQKKNVAAEPQRL